MFTESCFELNEAEKILKCLCSLRYADTFAGVAQTAEQLICNQLVGGSIPLAGSIMENGK